MVEDRRAVCATRASSAPLPTGTRRIPTAPRTTTRLAVPGATSTWRRASRARGSARSPSIPSRVRSSPASSSASKKSSSRPTGPPSGRRQRRRFSTWPAARASAGADAHRRDGRPQPLGPSRGVPAGSFVQCARRLRDTAGAHLRAGPGRRSRSAPRHGSSPEPPGGRLSSTTGSAPTPTATRRHRPARWTTSSPTPPAARRPRKMAGFSAHYAELFIMGIMPTAGLCRRHPVAVVSVELRRGASLASVGIIRAF